MSVEIFFADSPERGNPTMPLDVKDTLHSALRIIALSTVPAWKWTVGVLGSRCEVSRGRVRTVTRSNRQTTYEVVSITLGGTPIYSFHRR